MTINNQEIFKEANAVITELYGEKAAFRDGQYEAIEATMLHNRTLVVQKTGWGKSLVYFVCTKLLRKRGRGVTFVISPLLSLMENQIESAHKIGLSCNALNSKTRDQRADIIDDIIKNKLDLVLITPETLFSEDIQNILNKINIGLFVIDEAHCVSDWGHDFRLDYSNIYKVLNKIPKTVPVLGTTATANDRVVEDLKKQLGDDVYISRGPLLRKNLSIQVLHLDNTADRFAWILENIPKLEGNGIIYCLTRKDCNYLNKFLQKNNINSRSYYSRSGDDEALNIEAEQLFRENKIKVLVATIKLGMGYDKGDIAFVIHYQLPSNIVAYYQQIGRAGRSIDRAHTFLMCGGEDKKIQDYFIDTAFPTENESQDIVNVITESASDGIGIGDICSKVNISRSRVEKALAFLQNESFIYKEKAKYYLTVKQYIYNEDHYNAICKKRHMEQQQMMAMTKSNDCYNKYIVNCLDDNSNECCGICANCSDEFKLNDKPTKPYVDLALEYIEQLIIPIEPRKKWARTRLTTCANIKKPNEVGICLSKYGDPGYGNFVKEDKYSKEKIFREQLVKKSANVLEKIVIEKKINAITFVPSLRSGIVDDFAERLAKRLGLPCVKLLEKTDAMPQKNMENSSYQCYNALTSFNVIEGLKNIPQNIILIDDIIDSGWTLTVCGHKLIEAGANTIFPFALASSSKQEE